MCGIICLIDTMQTKIRIGFIHKKKGTTMDIINIAICDDNSEHISILEKYLFEISSVKIECDAYHSGESLVNAYKNNVERYDVVFLDMEMEKLNGIETANLVREFDEHIIIVFVTSHTEYMRESFKCSPFRFLLKPLDIVELKTVVYDMLKKLSETRNVYAFTENKTKVRLYCDDIIYLESQDHWIWIHTKENTYKICKSLSDVHSQLGNIMFCRVHKSFVINFHYIKTIKENDIKLYYCDKLIPISRSYKKEVISEYTNFLERDFRI